MNSPLCAFSRWFSAEVGRELTEGRRIGHQWRETSWTDRMLKELRALNDPRIVVAASNEIVTGADMDWWFVDTAKRRHICVTLQAKILHYKRMNSALWAYDEIAHPRNAPGQQARMLTGHALKAGRAGLAVYPLYLFYNCDREVPHTGSYPAICPGITIANGYAVARHIRLNRVGRTFPIDAKRFSTIRPMMIPLWFPFCGPSAGDIPIPDEIATLLDYDRYNIPDRAKELDIDLRAIPRPKVGDGVPENIERLIGLAPHETDEGEAPTRNTVIFLGES